MLSRDLLGRNSSSNTIRANHPGLELIEQQDSPLAIQLQINGRPELFTAHEVLAKVIAKLKHDAELYLEMPIQFAVATVPAYFNDSQRDYMKRAGLLAGLEFTRLVNEPTAAGIANRVEVDTYTSDEGKVLFYEVNDATCDITISLVEEGIYDLVSKLSVSDGSQPNISGKDFNDALLDHIISVYNDQNGADITADLGAMGRLRYEIDIAERHLSWNLSATITIQPRHNISTFTIEISPEDYQELNNQVFQKTVSTLRKAFTDSAVQETDIDAIVITGEPLLTARVKPFLVEYLGGKQVIEIVPSDEAFVRGAAKVARDLSEPHIDICCCLDPNPLGLGLETAGGIFQKVIPRNYIIPMRRTLNVTTMTDNQSKIVLHVFEGERPMTRYNKLLGTIEMDGIGPALAGVPDFKVSFELDPDRILKVELEEDGTGRREALIVDSRSRIHHVEIEALLVEAEENVDEDEAMKQVAMQLLDEDDGFGFASSINIR